MDGETETTGKDTLYHILVSAFGVIVVLSNIISVKMVPLPFVSFCIPAGLVTYPLTFLLSDLVTETFGAKKAQRMVYVALGMSLLSFAIIQMALLLPTEKTISQNAFPEVLGLSGIRIFSSLVAYFVAQLADIKLYAWIKRWTGSRFLWLRNNGSTCISQIIDTVVIDILFLYWGLNMPMKLVLPIMVFSYAYKAFFSLLSTPLLYVAVFLVQKSKKINNLSSEKVLLPRN